MYAAPMSALVALPAATASDISLAFSMRCSATFFEVAATCSSRRVTDSRRRLAASLVASAGTCSKSRSTCWRFPVRAAFHSCSLHGSADVAGAAGAAGAAGGTAAGTTGRAGAGAP